LRIIINSSAPELLRRIFYLLILSGLQLFAEEPEVTLAKIQKNKALIEATSKYYEVNPNYLSAIIYVERTLNYDWEDDALDVPLAEGGFNSSIGFCQVKMKTAYWIEVQLNDSLSRYFPGKKYSGLLKLSNKPEEIIKKLQNEKMNITYAAAYIRIMLSLWAKEHCAIDNKPDILGTLYSTGLFYIDGTERKPGKHPSANAFGRKVFEACKLFK